MRLASDVCLATGVWLVYKFGQRLLPLLVVFLSAFFLPGLAIDLRSIYGMNHWDNEFLGIMLAAAAATSVFTYWVWGKYYPEGSAKQAELDEIADEKQEKEDAAKKAEKDKSGNMVPERRGKKARAAARKAKHD
mmetsp:Transcript_5038/g.4179  ORF Transcript_5038/g.4179 Transcript_5038/m.4179 type:complete len:134 (+) Transcript_5038:3-404(+)